MEHAHPAQNKQLMKIRVCVFDDNSKRCNGLEMLIDSMENMDCVGTFSDCRNVIKCISQVQPDVVLMDIDMPHVNGIEGVRTLRTRYPDLKILMQTVFEDDEKIFAAVCAGANGYILKQANPVTLLEAIEEVMNGGSPMTPVIATKVLKFCKSQIPVPGKSGVELTDRELEVLELLAKGLSYKMIAEKCFISYPTVNSHITKIYQKLQVNSSAGAVSSAIRLGLIK